MTEPTGELFAAASSIQAIRIAEEEAQAQKAAEAADRQHLADQKKAADKQQSEERATAFLAAMREYKIPARSIYEDQHTFVGYKSGGKNYGPGAYFSTTPDYRVERKLVGEGWIIESKAYSQRHPDPTRFDQVSRGFGTVILENGITYKYLTPDDLLLKNEEDIIVLENVSTGLVGFEAVVVESPYAGEPGLALLGGALDMYGIVPEETTSEQ